MSYILDHMNATLGEFELTILLSVVRLGADAYGARIRRDASARARREYVVGAVYSTLQRLEDKGFVSSVMSDPTPVRGGRAKRCFRLTVPGERALRDASEARQRLWSGLGAEWKTS